MGYSNGTYTRNHNFSADGSAGVNILAARMDTEFDDLASALTNVVWTRDGATVPTVDIPMGGRKHINVAAATSVGNYMRVREFIENVPIFMQDQESSADRISVSAQYFTSVSANQAPVDGTKILVRANSDKSSAVMYLNGHSANVEFQDGNKAEATMVSGGIYELIFSSADAVWKIKNPDLGRTAAERSAGVTPSKYQYVSGPHVDCWRFMTDAMIAGTTDCGTAIQNALNSLPRGGMAILKPNDAGYQLGEASITVPYGCQLVGMTETGMPLNRYAENGSINSATLPGGVFFRVTSTSLQPIILRSNSCVRGITFWYPDQNWDITSLADSFTTYPATIQLGDSTDTGPFHPVVVGCQFLGATRCIGQYATDGTSVKGLTVSNCTGVLLGDFLRLHRATDVAHVSHCHLTPNAVTAFVGDSSVGGDVDVFRAKCAQAAKVFHIGNVDGLHVTDVFAFGVLNYLHANNSMYTGDTDEGFSGFIVNSGCDSCYQAFAIDRDNNAFPLNISNSFFAPNFRPNGVAGDSATQAFMYFAAGLQNLRINVSNVRISGGAVGEFPTNYSGQRDHDFGIAGALGTGSFINVDGFSSHNINSTILQSGLEDDVGIGNHTLSDTAQKIYGLVGFNARSGGFYFDGTQVVGDRITGWAAASGTATRTTFDTATVTTELLAQRVKALIDDLTTHGLIGT